MAESGSRKFDARYRKIRAASHRIAMLRHFAGICVAKATDGGAHAK
jgi:hypothetical protein